MKVKVIREFTDIHTRKIRRLNEVFECDEARLNEIQSVSKRLVKVIEDDEPKQEDQNQGEPKQEQKAKKGE